MGDAIIQLEGSDQIAMQAGAYIFILIIRCGNYFTVPQIVYIHIVKLLCYATLVLGDVLGIYRESGPFHYNKFEICDGVRKLMKTTKGISGNMTVGHSVTVSPYRRMLCGHPYFSAEVKI